MSTESPRAGDTVESTVVHAEVTDRPLDLSSLVAAAGSDRSGAVVSFSGVIRNHDGGRAVRRLSYSAHPAAGAVIAEVAAEVAAAHPGVRIAAAHRVGELEVGDVALVAAVAAPHRAEAFAACEALIETVKARVPIWKQQWFPDGTSEWVGL
ncbi:molybdenum cofactor biosynthesis protein MoaE [Tersicoccus solisilvae]|uniref:Molybdenum cofactor biosynthesis protein MoaE n=1 Tax=Tersicoccus solisilvae TaxID=1882339 RepID=A0ABQ1NMB2_9MICC|nr:molybdenum cofactor biosynthesis protein MoaE [Tersicoccus solisilvae]GGC78329.1 molybdenum cofactor biosynthesis protein MoaE [Tersicoccus solisilvae]